MLSIKGFCFTFLKKDNFDASDFNIKFKGSYIAQHNSNKCSVKQKVNSFIGHTLYITKKEGKGNI